MNFKTTLLALRSGWQFMAIGLLIAIAGALVLHTSATPTYAASATYVVSPGQGANAFDVAEGVKTLDSSRSRSIMTTLTEITMSDTARSEAFGALGLDPTTADLYTVESIVVPEANVIQTTVTGPDPELAAAITSVVGDVGGLRFMALYQIYDVVVLDPPVVPTEPSNIGLPTLLILTSLLGLGLGAAAALILFASGAGRRSMGSRLRAYDSKVTPIDGHSRFQRAG